MGVGILNFAYLERGLVLFVDANDQLMVFGNQPDPSLSERLRGHEDEMRRFLIAQARKGEV